ncbi:MAG: hypothetical protein V1872_06360 [bacterium]
MREKVKVYKLIATLVNKYKDPDEEIEIEDKNGTLVLSEPYENNKKEEFLKDIEMGYHLGKLLYSKRDELYDR